VLLVCLYSAASRVIKDIHVVALFKDRAIVMIDGKQSLLRTGDSSPEGVKLVLRRKYQGCADLL